MHSALTPQGQPSGSDLKLGRPSNPYLVSRWHKQEAGSIDILRATRDLERKLFLRWGVPLGTELSPEPRPSWLGE